MIVVLSDLHLAESRSFKIGDRSFDHNLPGSVYRAYFREISEFIREENIEVLDLVLAGDIFEMNRSTLWLQDNLRPYVNLDEVTPGSALENRILEILDVIVSEQSVHETLETFKNLAAILKIPVRTHFIPGNHDRLLNASGAIRKMTRQLLGIPLSSDPFDHQYLHYSSGEASALIRHGHEYDAANFGMNLHLWPSIPTFIQPEYYDRPVLGDIVTLEVAAKLPYLFKQYYTERTIAAIPELMSVYQRLIDFDNVRPFQALPRFLFTTPGIAENEVWRFLAPVIDLALSDIAGNAELEDKFISLGGLSGLTATAIRRFFKMHAWKRGFNYGTIRRLMDAVVGRLQISSPLPFAAKEACLLPGASNVTCIVSGHTHNPIVELLSSEDSQAKYYINSGTFRNVISATADQKGFGRLRSKARVVIFSKGETNPEYGKETGWSFDFVSRFGFGAEATAGQPGRVRR
jgi:UDP-2,3-diacylglucosamine pyrophosphatase LpxH